MHWTCHSKVAAIGHSVNSIAVVKEKTALTKT